MFYVFPRAVATDVCKQIIKDCKENVLEKASVYNYDKKSSRDDPKIRKTLVNFITDKDNKINELAWYFLREANKIQFHYDIEHFEAVQFAEYQTDDFFDWHQDASNTNESNEVRKLSLTLVLSSPDNFEGGELQFYNGGRPMQDMGEITAEQVKNDIKAQGTVIVFDSRDFHRVTPVVFGTRHSIVCWTVGPDFK
jgi:PKHD-type hydroxylase